MNPGREKDDLPPYSEHRPSNRQAPGPQPWHRHHMRRSRGLRFVALACLAFIVYAQWKQIPSNDPTASGSGAKVTPHGLSVSRLQEGLAVCSKLRVKPVDPIGLGRERNARYVDGHKPTLIKNATVWVGEPIEGTTVEDARRGKGWEWITADVFMEYGLIKRVEKAIELSSLSDGDVLVYDAKGRPLTTGIIDMHSHAGVDSLPSLDGNEDTNEMSADITPYVRSIDGIQPQDHQIQVIKSGGVTTSLILPGSANNIGGMAYPVKHAVGEADGRNETSATDMLADPEQTWRYMKSACGENAKRVYGKPGERGPTSRLGESWEFRHAYEQAAKLVREQDDWCETAAATGVESMSSYLPVELKWESLAALLRGQVHLNTHCYTIPDLEAFVDHTNEFKFPVRAFHHAHQTYLVPEILKRAWGGAPASALFATNMWYKAEAYIGSEYAGKHLYDQGLTPIYVSDNPVLNAQHVVFEAAKAYRFGLPYHAALASVTTAPAERLGLGQRLGKVKPGFDADVVVWDSDPLSIGASPIQVWIDGTAQYKNPIELKKPAAKVIVPDENLGNIVEEPTSEKTVIFTGVSNVLLSVDVHDVAADGETHNVVLVDGKVVCVGECQTDIKTATQDGAKIVNLKNGYLTPAFVAFGSTLGLNAIDAEKSTDNGNNVNVFSRAVEGLALDTKKLHTAHRYGLTRAISAPKFAGGATHHGTSAGFLTGALTPIGKGAIFAPDAAVHYTLDEVAKRGEHTPSISSAVGALRRKLLEAAAKLNETDDGVKDPYSESAYLRKVVTGEMPLAVTVHSADTIAAILRMKAVVESAIETTSGSGAETPKLRLVIVGGAEAHLVAKELAVADVGVVLAPLLSYRYTWQQRRALTGAPLTNGTTIDVLLAHGVKTAIGMEEDWQVRDLSLLAGIAYRNGGGRIGEKEAVNLISGNLYEMLGLPMNQTLDAEHFVIFEGSPFDIGSRIKAVGGGLGSVSVL